jgi:hypothetical protein
VATLACFPEDSASEAIRGGRAPRSSRSRG